jgi:hypothetical protein
MPFQIREIRPPNIMRTRLQQQGEKEVRGGLELHGNFRTISGRRYALDYFRDSYRTLAARLHRPYRRRPYSSTSRNCCDCFSHQTGAGQSAVMSTTLKIAIRVVGSFHSALRRTEDQTNRYLAALRNKSIHILGHPQTRIFNQELRSWAARISMCD